MLSAVKTAVLCPVNCVRRVHWEKCVYLQAGQSDHTHVTGNLQVCADLLTPKTHENKNDKCFKNNTVKCGQQFSLGTKPHATVSLQKCMVHLFVNLIHILPSLVKARLFFIHKPPAAPQPIKSLPRLIFPVLESGNWALIGWWF